MISEILSPIKSRKMTNKPTTVKTLHATADSQPAAEGVLARFVGKTVVVTGASDRGIGGAIVERLAQEGAAVAMLSREEPKRLIKRLARRQTPSLWTKCDITKTSEVRAAVEKSLDHFGRID